MAIQSSSAESSEAVRDLYEQITDLLVHAMGGCLHGGYFGGPNGAGTVEDGADRLTDAVLERCLLAEGQRLLDVGSGNGKVALRAAATHRVKVTGITLSEYQVHLSRMLADEHAVTGSLDFLLADMHDIPFPDETFDAAFAIESFCHIEDRTLPYQEIGRVLRTGGRLVAADFVLRRPIVDDERQAMLDTINASYGNGPILNRDDYDAAVRAAGLSVVEFTDIGEEVWPSFIAAAGSMRKARSIIPDMNDQEFHDFVDSVERFAAMDEIGYALVVVQKPVSPDRHGRKK